MDNTAKMTALLRSIRTHTNGAVVEAMASRDVCYPLSYGVAVHTVRQAAAQYAPDHPLAKLLYRQQIRELRLAGLYVADPAVVDAEELDFWAAGISCGEVGEHLAMMLARTEVVASVLERWLADPDAPNLLKYTALMTAAHALMRDNVQGWDWRRVADGTEFALQQSDFLLNKGIAAFLPRLWNRRPAAREYFVSLVQRLSCDPAYALLWADLEWQLEE